MLDRDRLRRIDNALHQPIPLSPGEMVFAQIMREELIPEIRRCWARIAELEGRDALTEKWMGHAMGGPMPADGE